MNFELVIPTLSQIETLYVQLKNRSHTKKKNKEVAIE